MPEIRILSQAGAGGGLRPDGRPGRRRVAPILTDIDYIENLTDQVYSRRFEGPKGAKVDSDGGAQRILPLYEGFARPPAGQPPVPPRRRALLGDRRRRRAAQPPAPRGHEADQGSRGWLRLPLRRRQPDFYAPDAAPEAVPSSRQYVKARWPMITFSLEPVTDEQNIDDAFTRRRDLQLAVAFALSSGGSASARRSVHAGNCSTRRRRSP